MVRLTRRRRMVVLAALVALLATAAGLWLLMRVAPVAPTRFGWPAELTTLAGNGEKGHADGEGGAARFADPFALAIDADGTLFVADGDRIRRIDPDGVVTTLPGRFDTPSGLALDKSGNLLVAETGANAIRRIAPDGTIATLAGDGTAGLRDGPGSQARFDGPIGIAVAPDGTIYVADSYNDRIRVIDAATGAVRTLAGGDMPGFADGQGTSAAFNTPSGLVVDRSGAILVADTGNDAIRRVERDGRVSTLAQTLPEDRDGPLKAPIGLAQTWDGFTYIASWRRGRIVQMAPSGELQILTGRDAIDPGNATLRLASPAGLALDRGGTLYVADASQYAVRKLAPRAEGAPVRPANLRIAPPAVVAAANVPWPVAPQTGWHEVVGDLGEVRGNYQGESRDHLHAGLDIHAGVGEPVLAVADETVVDPIANWGLEGLSEGLRLDALTYIHLRVGRTPSGAPIDPARFRILRDPDGKLLAVRVKRGARFRVGDPLGTANRMAHVHLELGPPGGKINALQLRFPGFADHFPPQIAGVQILDEAGQLLRERQGDRLVVRKGQGPLAIVVDAWDQVDGNAPRRRLGLYSAGFQILHADGRPVRGFERPRISLHFDRMPLDREAVRIAYADASGVAVHTSQPTRFLYVVSNHVADGRAETVGWHPDALARGDYIIRAYAADFAGNQAQANRDLAITVR